jgi:hypothetical protein
MVILRPGAFGDIEMIAFLMVLWIVPNVSVALRLARDEAYCWSLAGAKGFSLLTAEGAV